jgi:hypothetical protein
MDSRIDDGLRYEAPHVRRWRRACSLASSLPAPHAALVVFKLRWRSATMPETLRSEDPGIRQSRATLSMRNERWRLCLCASAPHRGSMRVPGEYLRESRTNF